MNIWFGLFAWKPFLKINRKHSFVITVSQGAWKLEEDEETKRNYETLTHMGHQHVLKLNWKLKFNFIDVKLTKICICNSIDTFNINK